MVIMNVAVFSLLLFIIYHLESCYAQWSFDLATFGNTNYGRGNGGGCQGCPPDVLLNCPVPSSRNCQQVRRPCGCCAECALRTNVVCSSFTPPCGRNLLCLHNNGTVAKKFLRWDEFDFVGRCRRIF